MAAWSNKLMEIVTGKAPPSNVVTMKRAGLIRWTPVFGVEKRYERLPLPALQVRSVLEQRT